MRSNRGIAKAVALNLSRALAQVEPSLAADAPSVAPDPSPLPESICGPEVPRGPGGWLLRSFRVTGVPNIVEFG